MKTNLNKTLVWTLVTALFFTPGGLLAQGNERTGSKLGFGIKGGLSFPSPSEAREPYPYVSPKKPVFGLYVAYNSSSTLSAQLEVYYLTQSRIEELVWSDGQGNLTSIEVESLRMYIHAPLLAKFRIVNKGALTPVLFAGPAVSVGVKTSTKPEIAAPAFTSEFKGISLSAVFGGGLEASVGNIVFSVDVRYDLGFADIRFESADAKTNSLMVTAGFGF